MRNKLTLDVEQLAVESYETSRGLDAEQGGEPLPSCLQTQCGNIECCA